MKAAATVSVCFAMPFALLAASEPDWIAMLISAAAAGVSVPLGGRVLASGRLRRYQALAFRDAEVGALILTPDLRILHANASVCRLLGRPLEELRGTSIRELLEPRHPPWHPAPGPPGPDAGSDHLRRADGSLVEVALSATDFSPARGQRLLLVQMQDVGAQRRAERELAAIAGLSRRALECYDPIAVINDAIVTVRDQLGLAGCITTRRLADTEVRVVAATGGLKDEKAAPGEPTQSAYTLEVGEPVISEDLTADARFAVPAAVLRQGFRQGLSVTVPERGGARHVMIAYLDGTDRSFTAEDSRFLQAVAEVVASALDRSANEDELRRRALEDPLTGLANRTLMFNRLEAELRHSRQLGHRVHVIAVELDRFKLLSESLGPEVGDAMLRIVAARLLRCARHEDLVARAGEDEFTIIATRTGKDESAQQLARCVHEAIAEPCAIDGREVVITASVGLAAGTAGELTGAHLMRDAELAMRHAREAGGGRHELFTVAMRDRLRSRLALEYDLRGADERDELELHYQPLLHLEDRSIVGFEALIRWNHPRQGLLGPGEFIQIAEESHLILPIGAWVLRQVCEQLTRWPEHVYVAANVSAVQIGPELVEQLEELLSTHAIAPRRLVLEITESLVLDPRARPVLEQLRGLGVRIALDDFGTGYSSLGSLHHFPIDLLKLDRSLITAVLTPRGNAVVRAAIELGRALGVAIVAEGIETEAELDALRRLRCPLGQGFHFSKPLPTRGAEQLLQGARLSPAAPEQQSTAA